MKKVVFALVLVGCLALALAQPRASSTTRPTSTMATRRSAGTAPSTNTPTTQNGDDGGLGSRPGRGGMGGGGGHGGDKEPEEFSEADLAGSFAILAKGVVQLPIGDEDPLFVALEGRLCLDSKGNCAIDAFANLGGFATVRVVTDVDGKTKGGDSGGATSCIAEFDEFGRGTLVVPIKLASPGQTSMFSSMHDMWPTTLIIRAQAYNDDQFKFEIESCGVAAIPEIDAAGGKMKRRCTPETAFSGAGRTPIALAGTADRITFRCSNCAEDDFNFRGLDEEVCPADFKSHGGGSGPRRGGSHYEL